MRSHPLPPSLAASSFTTAQAYAAGVSRSYTGPAPVFGPEWSQLFE